MSIWTYINGYVKFDKVDTKVLGKIVTFDDMINECEEECITTAPTGSEGSVEYEIIGNYAIFNSSLRDFSFSDFDELKEYFYKISESEDFDSMNITVRVSTGERFIFYKEWEDDKLNIMGTI